MHLQEGQTVIIKSKRDDCRLISDAVVDWLRTTRFRADVYTEYHPRWREIVRIANLRLRVAKDYCGQHPDECLVNPFFTKKHRKSSNLEVADYVRFND